MPGGLRPAGIVVGVVRVCGLGAVPCFSLPSACLWQLFLTVFSSLCALLSPILPVSPAFLSPHNGLPLPFLRPGPFFSLSSLLLLLSPLPSFLDFLTFSSPSLPALAPAPCPPPLCPLQMEKLLLPAVDLEQWYQELMAGLGTGPAAASPRSSPPPLPAKASRQLQVTPPSLPSPAPLGSGYLLLTLQPHTWWGINPASAAGASGPRAGSEGPLEGGHPGPRGMEGQPPESEGDVLDGPKGAWGVAVPVQHSTRSLCPGQLSSRSLSPSPHTLLSLLPLALVCPGRVAGLCSPGLPRDDSRRRERVGQRLSGDGPEFMPRTQSRHEGVYWSPKQAADHGVGQGIQAAFCPRFHSSDRPWCLINPLPRPLKIWS